ncbi:MAG: ABC transporter substrate binding protein [Desulfobacteraceae bacterium]
MKVCMTLCVAVAVLLLFSPANAANRILYIDSYHEGFAWSDGITEAIQKTLRDHDVNLKIHRMDTKRNPDEKYKIRAAQIAKSVIDNYRPDLVIASDDNASKYLIMPYYKNGSLPFLFCGVNYSADAYGFPYSNVTGMIEVAPVIKLIYSLKHFTRIETVGYLAQDTLTERKDGAYAKRDIREKFIARYVKTFEEWKREFLKLQDEVDVLIVGNNGGIKGWNERQAQRFVENNTRIPSGCLLDWLTNYAFLGATRLASEQGEYVASTALKIIDGTPVDDIPIVRNTQADIIINLRIANKLGLKIPNSFRKIASRTIE